MVKGINRQVLEIRETGSKYFERAFFFVNPDYAKTDEKKLRAAAESALCSADHVPKTGKRKAKGKQICLLTLSFLGAAGGGAILTALFLH